MLVNCRIFFNKKGLSMPLAVGRGNMKNVEKITTFQEKNVSDKVVEKLNKKSQKTKMLNTKFEKKWRKTVLEQN
jgi:hypothetical protein